MTQIKDSLSPTAGLNGDQEEDFASLFEASSQIDNTVRRDNKITGNIVSIGDEWVFVDIGYKSEGAISREELLDSNREMTLKVGDPITAYVITQRDGDVVLSVKMTQAASDDAMRGAHKSGIPVEGIVTEERKGGYSVNILGRQAFCPYSQIDITSGGSPEDYVGNKFLFRIMEFSDKGRNIVLSRRETLEEDRKNKIDELKKTLCEGAIVEGVVRKLAKFGAFVDIGGPEGLIPMSELSWARIESVEDVLSVGDKILVRIIGLDWEKSRIGLSLKQARENPWDSASNRFSEGFETSGVVTRLTNFGAFVELEPGIEGLIHISNLGRGRRINHPKEVITAGESVRLRIISVDPDARRVALELITEGHAAVPDGPAPEIVEGAIVTGRVQSLKDYGIFVDLPNSRTGLLRTSEIGDFSPRELRKKYPLDSDITVKILAVDQETQKIALSLKALENTEEKNQAKNFLLSGETKSSFGTLGELLKAKLDKK
jgi:small subunit ribosomal protein S1